MKAILLCAGKGTRLKPLTDTMPKPLVPVLGKPIVEWLILTCKHAGLTEIGINLSHFGEQLKDHLGNGSKWGVSIIYSEESTLLGTAGALNGFRDFLKERFVIIYGDLLTDLDIQAMVQFHIHHQAFMTLGLRKKETIKPGHGMVILDPNHRVQQFLEKPSEDKIQKFEGIEKFANSGLYVCEPQVLDFIPPGFSDFGYDIIPALLQAEKPVFGYDMTQAYFHELGTLEKVESASTYLKTHPETLSFLL